MTEPISPSTSRRAVLAGALGVGGGIALAAGSEDAALAAAVPQDAVCDYYLAIDGIEGGSTATRYPRTIELLTWSFGDNLETNAATGGMTAGRSHPTSLVFVAAQSMASPKLWLHVANGKMLHTATLNVVTKGERPLNSLTIKLEDLRIASYHSAPDESDGLPLDVVHLDYRSLSFTQRSVNRLGAVVATTAGWDFHANASL